MSTMIFKMDLFIRYHQCRNNIVKHQAPEKAKRLKRQYMPLMEDFIAPVLYFTKSLVCFLSNGGL